LQFHIPSNPLWLEFTRNAMACQFDVLLHPNHPPEGPEAAVEALETIEYLEGLLSIYRPTSDLSRLNHRGKETWVDLSLPAMELLKIGHEIFQATGGAFDITAAKLSDVWGFSSRQGRVPTEEQISDALKNVGSQHLEFDPNLQRARFHSDIAVNPGGIGKGYAIDQAVAILLQNGVTDFAIHGGKSSVVAHGKQLLQNPQTGWNIAVRHPEQSERILGTLVLRDRALGTSGPANQFFYFRGVRYGHIIDPRTGWPASGILSLSVTHPNATWADALATGLYVMGIDQAVAYCEAHPETGMLAILPGKRVGEIELVTCNLSDECWIAARE
jgi:thiamine biosynthesis lipoprotein